ncbi:MAG: HAD hydrolase family protein [Planctomycetota bacterium]|nr:HAD hydrolase family protein [Planctomycetota bacterium]
MEASSKLDPQAKLVGAKLLALDVDGVMTDGKVVYSSGETGIREEQHFDVQDGIALRWLSKSGFKIVWITGRGCAVTAHRAAELKIDALEMHVESKREVLERLQTRFGISVDETIAMGDDLPDLGMRVRAGFFAAPANAVAEIRDRSDLVLSRSGGDGAVRELAEILLRARGRWQEWIDAGSR